MEDFNEDSVVNLLASDNYIVVNRSLIKELGLKEAILLGELASEYNYYKKNKLLNEDGYFYSTIENIKNNTSLSVFEQKKCLDNLSKRNIINVVLKGIPATRYIKINSYQLTILFANNLKTSLRETNKLDCEKLTTKNNKKNNKEDINKEIYKERFKKPTLEDIEEYCRERNNSVNAKTFYDYYEAGDWKDKSGNKVKNWKQKLITWEKKDTNNTNTMTTPSWFEKNIERKEITKQEEEELQRLLDEF